MLLFFLSITIFSEGVASAEFGTLRIAVSSLRQPTAADKGRQSYFPSP